MSKSKRKAEYIAQDSLAQAAKIKPDSVDFLHHLILSLSEEIAALSFERKEADLNDGDSTSVSLRKVNALKSLADAWFKRKQQLGGNSLDIESEAFKAAMGFVMETFHSTMVDTGVRPETIQTIFSTFGSTTKSDTWNADLRDRIDKASK